LNLLLALERTFYGAASQKGKKKSPQGCRALKLFGTAGGDLPYGGCFGLAVNEFLKLIVPGAFFAKYFRVFLNLSAIGFSGLGIKDNLLALQFEFIGFVFIVGIFDKKIQATAYRTFHHQ
jgi:hypothetical protein